MPLDLSSIEASGEQFVINAAQTAAAKVRPGWFTDETQAGANALISAGVVFAVLVVNAFLNRNKAAATPAAPATSPTPAA